MNRLTMILIVIAMPIGAAHAGQNLNFQVNDFTDAIQQVEDLSVAPDKSVVIVWNSGCHRFLCPGDPGQDGDDHGVFAKRLDKDGNDLPPPTDQGNGIGNEFQLNTFTIGLQNKPSVDHDAIGRFVVVWRSNGQGDGEDIYGQRFDAQGNKLCLNGLPANPTNCPDDFNDANGKEPEFRVNANPSLSGNQVTPDVGVADNGDFVVTWTDRSGNDGDRDGVFAQRFDNAGIRLGSSFQVNTHTTADQHNSDFKGQLAMHADGRFVIVWHSGFRGTQDGSGIGVFAQRFDSNGDKICPDGSPISNCPAATDTDPSDGLGSEFRVNNFTTGNQLRAMVAIAPSGDFWIIWNDQSGQDGDRRGVFAQRFDSNGNKVCSDGFPFPAGCPDDGVVSNGLEPEFRVNTETLGSQTTNGVAVDANNNLVVAWHSGEADVFVQRFDFLGEKVCGDGLALATCPDDGDPSNGLAPEVRMNLVTAGSQASSKVEFVGNDILFVFKSHHSLDGEAAGVFAQLTPTRTGTDTLFDHLDTCISVSNPGQEDTDGSGIGDACNDAFDPDGDDYEDPIRGNCVGSPQQLFAACIDVICGHPEILNPGERCADNCENTFNPDQADSDNDTFGDACQPTATVGPFVNAGNLILGDVRINDPNEDELSGTIQLSQPIERTLAASPFRSCTDLYLPEGVPGEAFAYTVFNSGRSFLVEVTCPPGLSQFL